MENRNRHFFGSDFVRLPEILKDVLKEEGLKAGCRICIIADSNTAPLYAEDVKTCLSSVFSETDLFVIPAGEENKTLDSVKSIYAFLVERHYDRHDMLAALGGGVIGDMTGFAAATYMRGISFIQIPTTLLAQVDSSIGGKTGVDFDGYKNMVGAFHLPNLIYVNADTLKTLPEEQFASGMGEVLKTALLADEDFYSWLLSNMDGIIGYDPDVILPMIRKTASIKERIVERDPTEKGERVLLNLGHTIGHAIEKYMDFKMLHGKCVALGVIAAARISFERGYLSTEELFEIRDVCAAFGLPIFADGIDDHKILALTKSDKKMSGGKIRFILLKSIGRAEAEDDVSDSELLSGIKFINGDEIAYEE